MEYMYPGGFRRNRGQGSYLSSLSEGRRSGFKAVLVCILFHGTLRIDSTMIQSSCMFLSIGTGLNLIHKCRCIRNINIFL